MIAFGSNSGRRFGNGDPREERITNILKSHKTIRPIEDIACYFQESSGIRRGHFFGYAGNVTPCETTRILIGLCCEDQGPSIANYIALEAAGSIREAKGCTVRAIIPTYEFLTFGFYSDSDIKRIQERTYAVLGNYDFETKDPLNDDAYRLRRLDLYTKLQRYADARFRDPVGDEHVGMQMGLLETADILLCMEEGDTLFIGDQGSARPALGATPIAKKWKISHQLGCLFYAEPSDITGHELMYYADNEKKIYLKPGDEEKIKRVKAMSCTSKEFKEHGGNPETCLVSELESIMCPDDETYLRHCEQCMLGTFDGCADHKGLVQIQAKGFLEAFR